MKAKDFRKKAREALSGNWVLSVIVTLVASILGASVGSGNYSGAAGAASNAGSNDSFEATVQNIITNPLLVSILLSILAFASIYMIIVLIFGGATKLGLIAYNLDIVSKRRDPSFGTLFSRYNIFLKAIGLQIMMSIFIFLWTLLLIIPGIIASYKYAMAPYIMAENPDVGVMEAISRSKEMMNGHKWRLFCLEFSFIGWHLLAGCTFGLGYLFLNPYICASVSAFYLELTNESNNIVI